MESGLGPACHIFDPSSCLQSPYTLCISVSSFYIDNTALYEFMLCYVLSDSVQHGSTTLSSNTITLQLLEIFSHVILTGDPSRNRHR